MSEMSAPISDEMVARFVETAGNLRAAQRSLEFAATLAEGLPKWSIVADEMQLLPHWAKAVALVADLLHRDLTRYLLENAAEQKAAARVT